MKPAVSSFPPPPDAGEPKVIACPDGVLFSLKVVLDVQSHFTVALARAIGDFSRAIFADADCAARLRMAAHELLENAVQYGTSPTASLELTLEEGTSPAFFVVTLKASNETSLDRLREAAQCLTAVGDASDPIGHYDDLVRMRANQDGSGLGLARIRAEGEFAISYDISATELSVMARITVPRASPNGDGGSPRCDSCFDCETRIDGDLLMVRIAGEGGMEAAEQLDVFLSGLPARASSLGLGAVRLDLQRIEFLSSSCLKAFTNLVLAVEQSSSHLQLEFVLEPRAQWQQRSFGMLQRLAPTVVTLS